MLMAPASQEVQFNSWHSASAWVPDDDPEYVLDPDGDWYNEVVEGPVEQLSPPTKTKKKKSQVSAGFGNGHFPPKSKYTLSASSSPCLAGYPSPRIS